LNQKIAARLTPLGSANWLVEKYGCLEAPFDPEEKGVIWSDYDTGSTDTFSVLVDTREVEDFVKIATDAGYEITEAREVDGPLIFGDGHSGTVDVCQHPHGWIVLE